MKFKYLLIIPVFFILCGCSFINNKEPNNLHEQTKIPQKARILLEKSIREIKFGEYQQAIKDLSELTNSYPSFTLGYYNLGLAYANNGEVKKAINSWEILINLDKKYADAYFNLGKAYRNIDTNKSIQYFNKYISLRPDDPSINTIKKEIFDMQKSVNKVDRDNLLIRQVLLSDNSESYIETGKTVFKQQTPAVYAIIVFNKKRLPENIKVKWYYFLNDNEMIPVNLANFATDGSSSVSVSLKKPQNGWQIGIYKIIISVDNIENAVRSFEIKR